MTQPVNLSDILAKYRNGDRGLLTYQELLKLEKYIHELETRQKAVG